MKIIFSKKSFEYYERGHPESPERTKKSYDLLKNSYTFIEAEPCSKDDLLSIHSKKHVEDVKSGNFNDPDTPALNNIYDYAILSTGAAIHAALLAIRGEKTFSLMRPPGHHASDSPKGFCYFNNIAVAISKLLKEEKINKAAILDIDIHHGDGTQNLFLGNKSILFCSIHQSPLYPGTGLNNEKNCINFHLPPGTSENIYLQTLEKALKKIKQFKPDILGVSAGFDTYIEEGKNWHERESLGNFRLNLKSYRKIGEKISKLKTPTFAILEGGYSKSLPSCIYQFLLGFR